MQIEPMMGNNGFVEQVFSIAEAASQPSAQNAQAPLAATSTSQDPLQNLQRQFSALVKDFSKQLAALEKGFSQLLRQVVKNGAPAAKPCPPPATPASGRDTPKVRYTGLVAEAARDQQLDPALLSAVIQQESGYDPHAVSSAGAMGLMQLMPDTARSLGIRDPFDPQQNIRGGAQLLRQLLDRYGGNLDFALAAYNAGPAAVDKYGGVPPFAETQAYVRNVSAAYRETALGTQLD